MRKSPSAVGFSTLEIIMDGDLKSEAWQFSLLKEEGIFYDFKYLSSERAVEQDSAGENEESEEVSAAADHPEIIVLSFVNNDNGFFLSRSNSIDGPFAYQEFLNFQIVPYNYGESGLDAIKEIRLYQD